MFWGFAKRPHMGYNIFICESAAILAERGQTMAEKQNQQLMKLEGVVEHVIYENAESGYAVFEVDAGGTDVVVAGNVGGVDNGMSVTVYGHMVNHPSYGEQFKAETIEASLPEDTSAILSYLSSGVLPYIGPSTAKKLVAKFGEDTLNVIAQTPQKLCELKGINEQKAAIISNEFRRMYGVREVVAWFARYGLTAQQAVTAYRAFGPHTVEALTQNPYLLCGEPLQLKFGQVDGIAAALQFETGCRLRVAAGLLYALRHNAGNGHTCLPRDKLLDSTSKFLRVPPDEIEAGLDELLSAEELRTRTFDGVEYIYLPDLLSAEEDIAARLGQLSTFPTEVPKTLDADIRVLEMAQGFEYAPLQKQAIKLALSSRVMVLTGGPGTGKTTTVNAILSLYEALYDRVALCAPTGRAAKRLSELTGHAASTIHRLLEVDYSSGNVRFIHNEKNLLKYDVIILDEMSMVDVKLFQALLAAARYHCRIIMVGDADQLPSVGPGNILGEILRAGVVPTVRLTDIFRQAQQSLIVQNAHRIVEGRMPQKGGAKDDFFLIESTGLACQKLVCDLVSKRLPKAYGFDPVKDIQVLCPTKVGPTGSVELNKKLQEILNPPAKGRAQIGTAESAKILRLGDKVMQVKNDYDITFERDGAEAGVGAYNGDLGIITAVDVDARAVTVMMDDRKYTYTADQLNELEPAYAVTVHKSQGSEFPAVVLPVADVPARLCYRNLLYTGVTRARKLCVLTGTARTEQAMVENVRQNMRYSGLRYLLKDAATPTIGAVDTRTNSIIAVGDEALKMVGRAPAHIDLVRPLRDGIIQDHRMTNELIVRFVNEVCRSRIFKPRIAVCVPAAITGIEADAVVESVMAAGAKQVFLVDEPVAAALGAGLQIRQPHGCMVVDIGGGSTDIAVISMGGRVKAASLPVAGNAFDNCIAQYIQEKYQIAIGPLTAEQLKKQVACCTRSEFEGVMEVRGHSWETNLPARRLIYTRDLYEPVQELAARIATAARNVLESTPPELAADVSSTGVLLTGGGSLLRGLASYIAGELHTDVAIAPDPLNCVARGTAISLSEGKYLTAGFRDATPKSWNRRLNHTHDPFTAE